MRIFLFALSLFACASTPPPVRPTLHYATCRRVRPEPDRLTLVRQLTEEAAAHFAAAQYMDAVGDSEEAYNYLPNSAFLYNIAQAYAKLDLYDRALVYMERFIRSTNNPADAEKARERYTQLEALNASWNNIHGGQRQPLSAYAWSHMRHDDIYPNGHKHEKLVCE